MKNSPQEFVISTLDGFLSLVPTENPLFQIGNRNTVIVIKEALRKRIETLKTELLEGRIQPQNVLRAVLDELSAITERLKTASEINVRLICIVEKVKNRVDEIFQQNSQSKPAPTPSQEPQPEQELSPPQEPQPENQEPEPIPPETVSGPIVKGHPLHTDLINQIISTSDEKLKKILRLMASKTPEEIVTPPTIVEAGIAENTSSANRLIDKLADTRPFYVTRGEKEDRTFRLHLCYTKRPSEKEQIQIPEDAIKDGPITARHPLYQKLQEFLQYGTGAEREREILLFLSLLGPGEHSDSTQVAKNTGCLTTNQAKVTIKGTLTNSRPFYIAQVPIPGSHQQALFLCYREITRGPIPNEAVAGPIVEGHPLHNEYQEFTAKLKEGQLKEILEYAATLPDRRPFTYKELTGKTSTKYIASAQRQCALMLSTRPFYFEIRKLGAAQILYLCYQKTDRPILPDQGFVPPPETPSTTPILKTSPQKAKEWLASVMNSEPAAKIVRHLITTRAENESTTYGQIEKATGLPSHTIPRTIEDHLLDSTPFCLTKTKEGTTTVLTVTRNEPEEEPNHQDIQIDYKDYLDWKTDQLLDGLTEAQDAIEYLALALIGTKFPIEEIEQILNFKTSATREIREQRLKAILQALSKTKPIYIEIFENHVVTHRVPSPPKKPAVRHPEYREWRDGFSPETKHIISVLATLHPSAILPLQRLLQMANVSKEQIPRTNTELINSWPLHLSVTVDENGTSYYKLTESEYTLASWLYSVKQHAKDPQIIRLAESLAKKAIEQKSFGIQIERVVIRKAMRGDSDQEISHEEINSFAEKLEKFPPLILVPDRDNPRRFKFTHTRRKISAETAARLVKLSEQRTIEENEQQTEPLPPAPQANPAKPILTTTETDPKPQIEIAQEEKPNSKPLKEHKDFKSWKAPGRDLDGARQARIIQALGDYPLGEELKLSKFAKKITNLGEDRYLLPLLRGLARTSPIYVEIFTKKGDTYIATRLRETA